ncbi:MAG: phosphoribosylformylglycinamidine cyclo-ligase [Spirochaetales bacterium]|jgi:phosphoribosylformylglycinamidine cyclo-ligase|nr:phosphoribosylformylglycinamidine cyclo-ligase [Spirochaetales bacterium]|tara:strand:- start:1467 stop:2480 length:1014 start_codon:yes stop_codon:yes gene_type:complete
MKDKVTYKDSGVDIAEGDKFVQSIQPYIKKTLNKNVVGTTTSFAALFSIDNKKYQKPLLVACTDGVGSKIEIGIRTNKIKGLGIDLVAMCVNDLLCTGATPLFFLDYLATSKLQSKYHSEIIKGISEGCIKSECALIGGETAEIPGVYRGKDFDLAGFAVGVVEKDEMITNRKIKSGDLLIGLPSSGIHSNGYSLVRKLFFAKKNNYLKDKRFINSIMKPTRIYFDVLNKIRNKFEVKGIAHITGGGLVGNIPRMIPKSLGVELVRNSWPIPQLFDLIQTSSRLHLSEMFNIFNMGIGLVLCVQQKDLAALEKSFRSIREKYYIIGKVTKKTGLRII